VLLLYLFFYKTELCSCMKIYHKKDILLNKLQNYSRDGKIKKVTELYREVENDFSNRNEFESILLELKEFHEIYYEEGNCAILVAGKVRLEEGGYYAFYKAEKKLDVRKLPVNIAIVIVVLVICYFMFRRFYYY